MDLLAGRRVLAGVAQVAATIVAVTLGVVPPAPATAETVVEAPLLAVGSGVVQSDDTETWISVLDQKIGIDLDTRFPRGLISAGDYVSVTGTLDADGRATATEVIRLGGQYVAGSSPVYLRGSISGLDASTATGRIGNTAVSLAQAYHNPDLANLSNGDVIAVTGFESSGTIPGVSVIAIDVSSPPELLGSGSRGINGSGSRGINGSGSRGINGSGSRGINGSGSRGINGSGSRGSTGSIAA